MDTVQPVAPNAWPVTPAERALRLLPGILSLVLGAVLFVITYTAGRALPVLADGALHARLIEEIAASSGPSAAARSGFPPLYHHLGALLYLIAGPTGIYLLSPIALALAGILLFLVTRALTGNALLGLLSQAMLALSPVLIWYGSMILMEPLVVAMVLLSMYALLRLYRERTWKNVTLAAICVSAPALVKQVGLVVPPVAVVFMLSAGIGVRRTLVLGLLVLLFVAAPYTFLYLKSNGLIRAFNAPPTVLREMSSGPLGRILYGTQWQEAPGWSLELDSEVDAKALYEQGTRDHERRHITWRSLVHWPSFVALHTLYPESFFGYTASKPWVLHILHVSLALGLLTAVVMAVRSPPWRVPVLLLLVSYLLMEIGSDTKRYFLYVSVISAPFPFLLYRAVSRWMLRVAARNGQWLRGMLGSTSQVAAPALVVALFVVLYPLGMKQAAAMDVLRLSQGGFFPTDGGVASLSTTAEWLKGELAVGEGYMAASPYEWEYYTGHPSLWMEGLNYRIYFLSPDRIDYYVRQAGARYVVIRDSQLVLDEQWDHVELVPLSFQAKIRQLYPEAYVSPYGDIRVYEVPHKVAQGEGQ